MAFEAGKKRIKWFTSRRSRILSSEMILFTMCTMYFCTRHINRYLFTFLLWQHFFQIVLRKLEHKDSSLRVRSALHDWFPTVKCKDNVNSIMIIIIKKVILVCNEVWKIFWCNWILCSILEVLFILQIPLKRRKMPQL